MSEIINETNTPEAEQASTEWDNLDEGAFAPEQKIISPTVDAIIGSYNQFLEKAKEEKAESPDPDTTPDDFYIDDVARTEYQIKELELVKTALADEKNTGKSASDLLAEKSERIKKDISSIEDLWEKTKNPEIGKRIDILSSEYRSLEDAANTMRHREEWEAQRHEERMRPLNAKQEQRLEVQEQTTPPAEQAGQRREQSTKDTDDTVAYILEEIDRNKASMERNPDSLWSKTTAKYENERLRRSIDVVYEWENSDSAESFSVWADKEQKKLNYLLEKAPKDEDGDPTGDFAKRLESRYNALWNAKVDMAKMRERRALRAENKNPQENSHTSPQS